jgi:hypothetical protein
MLAAIAPDAAPVSGSLKPKASTPPKSNIPEDREEAPFTSTVTPASKSTVQLYFTNGKGNFYNTTPRIIVLDARTGAEFKRFYRMMNVANEPEPQELPPGTYTFTFERNQSLFVSNVVINENENRKVNITITNGNLKFEYEGALTRPVKEYTALVKRNFVSGAVVEQKCNEAHSYEPGNYHIEINTLPPSIRNIDLDFGATYYIRLYEAGYVQFTNLMPMGKVSLYYQLGDSFSKFYILDINGNAESQKLRLQPGPYQVRYRDGAKGEITLRFQVKSNATTEVEL